MERKTKLFENQSFLIALLLVMAVYLPVNYFGFVNMDDAEHFDKFLYDDVNFDLFKMFFRDSATTYYRPLLALSFYLDGQIWGLSFNGYHFTNYLFHILNAILVYLIVLRLFKHDLIVKLYASFAMVLFGLHPLTCESVAWVSGRSDIAGAFFFLLAVNFYFLKNPFRFVLTPLAVFFGILCKENALAGIPIIVLMDLLINCTHNHPIKDILKKAVLWSIVMVILLFIYLFLRTNGWEYYTHKYIEAVTPSGSKNQVSHTIDVLKIIYIFPVIAFYLKKLVMPFPLNFAITQINTLFYSVLFIAFFLFNIIGLLKKKIFYVFFSIILVISFVPALPIALGGIAWVPLAERYLYLSVSIMSIAMVFLIKSFYEKGIFSSKGLIIVCGILILTFSVSTLNREFVWKDSQSLWADTLKKNPDSSMVLFKYGQAFGGEKGQWAYQKAIANSDDFKWKAMTFMEIANYERSVGNYDIAIVNFEKALNMKNSFKNYCEAAAVVLSMESEDIQKEQEYISKAIEYYQLAYAKKKPPFVLYKIGILLKKIDKIDEANELFIKIIKKYPASIYALHAKKQLGKNKKVLIQNFKQTESNPFI